MIKSFQGANLEKAWRLNSPLSHKTLITEEIFDVLDVIDAAGAPRDPAFTGFRFDEWMEGTQQRYGIMITDHWLISYGWSDGHAIDVDLERID